MRSWRWRIRVPWAYRLYGAYPRLPSATLGGSRVLDRLMGRDSTAWVASHPSPWPRSAPLGRLRWNGRTDYVLVLHGSVLEPASDPGIAGSDWHARVTSGGAA